MTGLRFVEHHVRGLKDIRAIMNSMKTLAYIETQKLSRIVDAQRAVTRQLHIAAVDLLAGYPDILPVAVPARHVRIVLGTERGFCGNLNQQLLQHCSAGTDTGPTLMVGRKLYSSMSEALQGSAVPVDGAGVAEEVPAVLNHIVDELETLRNAHGPATVSAVSYNADGSISERKLLPPFRQEDADAGKYAHAPLLNVAPERLLLDLTDQYLVSSLFEILYESLSTENHRRVKHLSDAVRHLDKQCTELTHRANALRQEQITEEIEVLLLSIGSAGPGTKTGPRTSRRSARSGSQVRARPVSTSPHQIPRGGTRYGREATREAD